METVYADSYFVIHYDAARRLVRIERQPTRLDLNDAPRVSQAMTAVLTRYSGASLLLDLRGGPPGRNDDPFERVSERWQQQLERLFPRQATLVRSAAGELQVRRIARERGIGGNVFRDEREALDYLAS
jgi:hypothetical protein